jgi:hypothetical protein
MDEPKEKVAKCYYPGCKCNAEYIQRLEVTNESSSPTEKVYVDLPFCPYHFYIVMGGNFNCESYEIVKEDGQPSELKFKLKGPFKEIELIQQVMGAREMTKKEVTGK